jgi:lambda family phage portal protein
MNLLDKAINYFSPARGLRREYARHMQAMLSYEGARSGRRQGGWQTSGTSGNAEIGPAAAKLRDNTEDLIRNNAFAKKGMRRWRRRVVGYGVTPQADWGSPEVNKIIDGAWLEFARRCCSDQRLNFNACLGQIVRTAYVRGECLIRLWDRLLSDGLPVPFQIQLLEGDYLDKDKVQATANGYIIHGVQFDLVGRIVGYWLFGQHPGDVVATSARGLTSKFVSAEFVIHHAELDRPGDVRTVGRMSAVIAKLRDLDEVGDAKLMRAKIEACLAMFVGQPEGRDGATLGPITDSAGQKIEEMRPGMIAYGAYGQKPEFFSPTGSGDYAQYKKSELKEVAAGLDQPYVVIGEDISDVNYSSFRGGAIDERDSVDEYRWVWLEPQVLDRIWRKFIDTLVMMGRIPAPRYGVKWNFPPFDLLDRKAEAEADELELRLGKRTWPQMVGDQAQDPEKQIAEIQVWKPRLAEAGVTFNAKAGVNDGNAQNSSPAA